MQTSTLRLRNESSRHNRCCVLTQALVWLMAPAMFAAAPGWTVLGTQNTNVTGVTLAAFSSNQQIVAATNQRNVMKMDATGVQIFSVAAPGSIDGLLLDQVGNIFISGRSGISFPGGVYASTPRDPFGSYVCKLSYDDGHSIFCTFLDVELDSTGNGLSNGSGFALDAAGNTYFSGVCHGTTQICMEKLNSTGTAIAYDSRLMTNGAVVGSPAYLAVGANGNAYIAHPAVGIQELDPTGAVIAAVTDLGGRNPIGLAADPSGNPEVLLLNPAQPDDYVLRRYAADLSQTVYETAISAGSYLRIAGLSIDSSGVTSLWGSTTGANLPVVHPTQICAIPAQAPDASAPDTFLGRIGNQGEMLQLTYSIPGSFLPGVTSQFSPTAGSILYRRDATQQDLQIAKLGPTASEVQLSCIGNGASFRITPVAPGEIVSILGAAIGPDTPAFAQPDAGMFPFQLAGTRVTFDGLAAPVLYASSGQVNVVTPHSLEGRTTTHVCTSVNSGPAGCIDMPVREAEPGVFTSGLWTSNGTYAYAAAVNQDGTSNTAENPATGGSILSIYLTALGSTTPATPDGGITMLPPPSPDLKSTVIFVWPGATPSSFFETSAEILYSGPAPLEVEGLWQINFVIPPAPGGKIYGTPTVEVITTLPDGTLVDSGTVTFWVK